MTGIVAENLASIREELRSAGVDSSKVTILGVTKGQSAQTIREGIGAGVTALGNNYAQDGESFMSQLSDTKVDWHFIGHIQSRKVKYLTSYRCIQSLDRLEIATRLDEKLRGQGRRIEVLLEVNIGEEPQKSGVAPGEVERFAGELAKLSSLELKGLMAMPPPVEIESRRRYFREVRILAERLKLQCLSMGTSEDFVVAAQEGATMLRLGTRLFGERLRK